MIDPAINRLLGEKHYLGPTHRGQGYLDEFGVLVLASPSSRRLPKDWLELTRWCLYGTKNGGSQQWKRVVEQLRATSPATTIVSYSDPSVGHTGALYRACNWWWAPTWHRLRTPPTGNGDWGTGQQAAKDRWVFPLRDDPRRIACLTVNDEALLRRYPWIQYVEPGGVPYKRWWAERAAEVA